MEGMPYRVKRKESVRDGIRRLSVEQIRRAERELGDRDLDDPKAVHQARKRFKKVRSVLRLLRKSIGKKAFKAENGRLRDLGKRLAGPRDADVALETFDDLVENGGGNFGRLRPRL